MIVTRSVNRYRSIVEDLLAQRIGIMETLGHVLIESPLVNA